MPLEIVNTTDHAVPGAKHFNHREYEFASTDGKRFVAVKVRADLIRTYGDEWGIANASMLAYGKYANSIEREVTFANSNEPGRG